MKINIRQIRRDGLTIQREVTPQSIDLEPDDVGLKSNLAVEAFFEKVEGCVLAKVSVEATYGYTCGRCLEEFEYKVTDQYDFDFELTPDFDVINLGEEIRQEIIMDHNPWMMCEVDDDGKCISKKPVEPRSLEQILKDKGIENI